MTTVEGEMQRALREGGDAARQELSPDICPYPANADNSRERVLRRMWIRGYQANHPFRQYLPD